MGSGNGSDNAHNSQFGGGSRGPTGGVNTGSGSSGKGGSGNGFGHYQYDMDDPSAPYKPEYNSKGEVVVTISQGPNWVSDDSINWSDGRNGGNSRDSTRTNTTAIVKNGYRAAIDGYIYMVTVNGNNDITAVNMYSRPITSTRKDWSKNESVRIAKAKALVQAQLDILKANAASEAKKTADAKLQLKPNVRQMKKHCVSKRNGMRHILLRRLQERLMTLIQFWRRLNKQKTSHKIISMLQMIWLISAKLNTTKHFKMKQYENKNLTKLTTQITTMLLPPQVLAGFSAICLLRIRVQNKIVPIKNLLWILLCHNG